MNQPEHSPDSLDAILADLADLDQVDQQSAVPTPPAANPIRPNPKFNELLHPSRPAQPAPDSDSFDQLLEDLKAMDAEGKLAAERQRQAEQQVTQERQQQAAHRRQAEQWLAQLDQATDEAAWFEAFAANYPSQVEAAIDYLGLASASLSQH